MLNKLSTRRSDAQSAVGDQVTAWITKSTLVATVIGLIAFAFCLGWRYQRIHINHQWLTEADASFFWQHEVPQLERTPWQRFKLRITPLVATELVSDFYAVKFDERDLSDAQLSRLSNLTKLRHLTLCSDAATDQTLSQIAELAGLRQLTLRGKQFTFEGLLQLRKLTQLRSVTLSDMSLSVAELAVLESAVPLANFKYNEETISDGHRRQVIARYPRAEPAPPTASVTFEPLFSTQANDSSTREGAATSVSAS